MMRTRRLVAVVVVASAFGSVALAEDDALVNRTRKEGRVLTDGKGHYIVLAMADPTEPDLPPDVRNTQWYGDGKTVYRMQSNAMGNDGTMVTYAISDPRAGNDMKSSHLEVMPKSHMRCEERVTQLSFLSEADARAWLAKVTFKPPRFERRALAAGREGTTYYVVDSLIHTTEKPRLFVGKRGAMKELKITRFNADADGVTVTTAKGVFQLARNFAPSKKDKTLAAANPRLHWTPKGGAQIELADLDTSMNGRLIYGELGIYPARLGYPCDDL